MRVLKIIIEDVDIEINPNNNLSIHHQLSSPSTLTGCLTSVFDYYACLLFSYSSFLALSCCSLMWSMFLAMNKSTISFHSSSFECWPLKIKTSLASNQNTMAIDLASLFPQGMTTSTKSSGASVLQRAIVGILTYEASITA